MTASVDREFDFSSFWFLILFPPLCRFGSGCFLIFDFGFLLLFLYANRTPRALWCSLDRIGSRRLVGSLRRV